MIVIDEKVSSELDFLSLNQDQIHSEHRFLGEFIPGKYTNLTKNSILIIETKAYHEKKQKSNLSLLKQKISEYEHSQDKLFIYNGIEVPSEKIKNLKNINFSDLEVFEILSQKNAQAIYGPKTQKENIILNTKNPVKDSILP